MPLAKAANRGIAGHHADGVETQRNQSRTRASARRRTGCLASGMAAANHDYVVAVAHRLGSWSFVVDFMFLETSRVKEKQFGFT
ncbi:hypothetical protein QFZ88_002735 [Mesorhizobium sp. YL-MeA3-2017]|nr:hypothetical protein [Mesorhizobium sp. YL-MeA3-2017]